MGTMCSSIPLQHICVVQGVSSADVARDVGFGVVSTLPTGYTEQHTHFHSRRVRGFVFCGRGRMGGKGRFPLLTKVICLEQMWLRIPKRKKKEGQRPCTFVRAFVFIWIHFVSNRKGKIAERIRI